MLQVWELPISALFILFTKVNYLFEVLLLKLSVSRRGSVPVNPLLLALIDLQFWDEIVKVKKCCFLRRESMGSENRRRPCSKKQPNEGYLF